MLCDLTVSKYDKLSKDYQSSEFGYSITLKDVPEELVGNRTAELQLRLTRMISHWEVLDGKKTAEQALEDVQGMEQYVREREKHGKRNGSSIADASSLDRKASA